MDDDVAHLISKSSRGRPRRQTTKNVNQKKNLLQHVVQQQYQQHQQHRIIIKSNKIKVKNQMMMNHQVMMISMN